MQEIILRNLKTKLGNYFNFSTDQKNLQSNSIKVWLTLFKTWTQSLWTVKIVEQVHHTELDLTDKLNLKNPNKNRALANLSIYYNWKNIKSECNNNKFKISAPTWNYTLDLPDGSYSISDIQDYFEYIIKKHETLTENPPVQIYPNKIKNRIVFKIKTGYKLELLTPETMKLLGSTKKDVDKDKDGDIVPKLESVEVFLVHCNLVKWLPAHIKSFI